MKIDILTIFPEMFKGPLNTSMVKKAQDIGAIELNIHNLRDWAQDKHKSVDDRPFGGGKGMVLRVDIVNKALSELKLKTGKERTILLSPQGKVFSQEKAKELTKNDHMILVCGHYEGFDERIAENLVDEELSIGDYVLTGGEIPAMVIVDSISRLLPGVLEKEAALHESFSRALSSKKGSRFLLDYPTYTRPEKYLEWKVPKVLLSGNHKEIEKWRKEMAIQKTKEKRPDLLKT